jgi:hypothetical protein
MMCRKDVARFAMPEIAAHKVLFLSVQAMLDNPAPGGNEPDRLLLYSDATK